LNVTEPANDWVIVMGRAKLALATAEATGAAIANPARYRENIDLSIHPLGPPSPAIINEGLIDEWMDLVRSVSWLTEADRRLVEMACKYRANRWRNAAFRTLILVDDKQSDELIARGVWPEEMTLIHMDHRANMAELRVLEKLGCTPTSRPKVTPGDRLAGGKVKRRDKWW
jgi:hypothetical protein